MVLRILQKAFFFCCILELTIAFIAAPRNPEDYPEVVIEQGIVVGQRENKEGVTFNIFRGIPFGLPPIDELRFMPPLPAEGWDGKLFAYEDPPICVQGLKGQEDCLYLNIVTPETALTDGKSYPVMVWIHGGAFLFGAADDCNSAQGLVRHDVIVVCLQYRLGVLGFFSTGDVVVPGNQGLKDQNLGLQWVKANIQAFGGDHNQVTLFGQSAGSASAHYQMLSPYSTGLFERIILMSGNAYLPWASGRDFMETSLGIAEDYDCPSERSDEILACLQDVRNAQILNLQLIKYFDWNFQPFHFAPRFDGDFIPNQPVHLVKFGEFNKVPTMIGTVRDEGALESAELYLVDFIMESLVDNFAENSPVSLMLFEDEGWDTTPYLVYDYYLGKKTIEEEDADNLTKLYTDRLFHMGIDWLVETQSDQVATYYYQLDHKGEESFLDSYFERGLDLEAAEDWICHADDLPFIWQDNLNDTDILIGEYMTTLWTNFAKTGNPTPDDSSGIIWPTASSNNLQHLSIALPPTMEPDSRQEEREFWESLPLRINDGLQEEVEEDSSSIRPESSTLSIFILLAIFLKIYQ